MTNNKSISSTVFKLSEDLTIYNAAALKEQLISWVDEHDDIALDVSAVAEMDTAGLQILLLAQQHASRGNKTFVLSACSSVVEETLVFCNVYKLLTTADLCSQTAMAGAH